MAVLGSRRPLIQGRVKTNILPPSGGEPGMCGDSQHAGVTVRIVNSQVASVVRSIYSFAVSFINNAVRFLT